MNTAKQKGPRWAFPSTPQLKLRQCPRAEGDKEHPSRKSQYHGTYTPVEELIAIEGHFTNHSSRRRELPEEALRSWPLTGDPCEMEPFI